MVDVNVELKTGQGVSVTPTTRASAITTIGRASVSPVISKTQGASISATQKQVSVEVGVGQTRDNYLSALKDVLLTDLLDNQLLKYNAVSGKWLNWTPNFLTSFTETDPVFTAWDKDYDDLTNKPTIPSALSDLSDDATHRIVTDTEKGVWNGKQEALNGTGFVKISGTTISYDNSTYSVSSHNHDLAYLGISAKASDSDKLNGQSASYYQIAGAYLTTISGLNISLLTNDSGYITSLSGAWLTTGDQSSLSGTKSGTYNLSTTGTLGAGAITSSTLTDTKLPVIGTAGLLQNSAGTGFVKVTSGVASYDNSTYYKSGDSPSFAAITSTGAIEGTGFAITGATHTAGKFLRADGTNFKVSTLILPNAATQYYIALATSANTYGEDAGLTYNTSTDLMTVSKSLTISGGTVTTAGLISTGKLTISGITGASGATGSVVSIATGAGGAGGSYGGAGGGYSVTCGNAAVGTGTAGAGGAITMSSGAGSSPTYGAGSAGGALTLTSGLGGSGGYGGAGTGGFFYITSGAGGAAGSAEPGGVGGNFILTGGAGGGSVYIARAGGQGGSAYFNPGAGGVNSAGGSSGADGIVGILVNPSTGVAFGALGIGTKTPVAGAGYTTIGSNYRLHFRDSAIYIHSNTDGYLDLTADTGIRLNQAVIGSSTIDCTGYKVSTVAGIDATIPIAPVLPLTVAGSATFSKGILTAYVPPS